MRVGLVEWRHGVNYSEIELPDGRVIPAVAHDTESYAAQAQSLGYPDGAAMNREHDAVHAALAGIFGVVSPVLLEVATVREGGRVSPNDLRWQEEALVEIVCGRLNDPSRDGEPGGGLVRHLRTILRGT